MMDVSRMLFPQQKENIHLESAMQAICEDDKATTAVIAETWGVSQDGNTIGIMEKIFWRENEGGGYFVSI